LKLPVGLVGWVVDVGSIHPQGWVPIETPEYRPTQASPITSVAFTPKGGCPLKREVRYFPCRDVSCVAFTPKGGCPLKHINRPGRPEDRKGSIHPQGWVPIETGQSPPLRLAPRRSVAFTPKGGCPLKLIWVKS